MSRYFTRPCSGKPLFVETPLWGDAEPQRLSISVSDHQPVDTGLVDQRGDPIMRAPEPVGFHHPRQR
jgi:hypothetical protein